MFQRKFTEEVGTYTVLILELSQYRSKDRRLPKGFEFASREQHTMLRPQEKRLLLRTFDDWYVPYDRKLPGFGEDSRILVVKDLSLIAGVYLCDKNEFEEKPGIGQLHYAYMHTAFRGQGIYGVMFQEAVRRAEAWGLNALYLNSDRYLLPEVYIRWGAIPWKVIHKPPPTGLKRVFRSIAPLWRHIRRQVRLLRHTVPNFYS